MYNDEWIKANYLEADSWKTLLEEHNRLFGTNYQLAAWKTHCTRKLGLHREQFRYTDEMNRFLCDTYPVNGRETFPVFNER